MRAEHAPLRHLAGRLGLALAVIGGAACWSAGAISTAELCSGAALTAAAAGAVLLAAPAGQRPALGVRMLVLGTLALAEEILFRALPLALGDVPALQLAAAVLATVVFVLLHGRFDPREMARLGGLAFALFVAYLAAGLVAAFLLHLAHNLVVLTGRRSAPVPEVARA